MNTTDTRHEIRTEKVEMSFKDGATATVIKKTIIESEKANPLIIIRS